MSDKTLRQRILDAGAARKWDRNRDMAELVQFAVYVYYNFLAEKQVNEWLVQTERPRRYATVAVAELLSESELEALYLVWKLSK